MSKITQETIQSWRKDKNKTRMGTLRYWRWIPAKRGMIVRDHNDIQYRILSVASGECLNVLRLDNNNREIHHPYDFDYLVNGEWWTPPLKAKADAKRRRRKLQKKRINWLFDWMETTREKHLEKPNIETLNEWTRSINAYNYARNSYGIGVKLT